MNKNKLIISILVLGMPVFLLANYSKLPPLTFSQIDKYLYKSVCDIPVYYKIGYIDPRFNLSGDVLLENVKTAAQIWAKAEGKSLFVYNPSAKVSLTVNLVYDKRQQLNNQITGLKTQVSQKDQVLKPQIDQYHQLVTDFKSRLVALNSQIESWNQKGGAPADEYARIIKEQEQLQVEAGQINQLAQKLNISAQSYNSDVEKLSQTIETFNEAVSQKPEEGVYNSGTNQIDIYFNNNSSELIHTLAHELGHSLGMLHNSNPLSIMYAYSTQRITPTMEDIKDLHTICAQRYLEFFGLIINPEDIREVITSLGRRLDFFGPHR